MLYLRLSAKMDLIISGFEDTNTGIYWMIPLSSRIDKYKGIVEKKAKAGKPCDIIHIVKLDDSRESAFLIQDMFEHLVLPEQGS